MMRIDIPAAAFVVASASGCATAVRGTTEPVTIDYAPQTAHVTTSLNHTCKGSPCVVELSRKRAFTVTAAAPGLPSRTVPVRTRVSRKGGAALAGNVLAGWWAGSSAWAWTPRRARDSTTTRTP